VAKEIKIRMLDGGNRDNEWIIEKARDVAAELGVENFVGSVSWVLEMKKRHRIGKKKRFVVPFLTFFFFG
jgi:hypothetical protein